MEEETKGQKSNTKWFTYTHQGEVLYSPFFKKMKKYFIAGPGDRHPTPKEIFNVISVSKSIEYDRDGICYDYNHKQSGSEIETVPGGIYNHEGYDDANDLPVFYATKERQRNV